MAYRQTLKLGMDELWKNAEAKAYAIISVSRLAKPQGAICAHFGPPSIFFGLILPGFCDFSGTC